MRTRQDVLDALRAFFEEAEDAERHAVWDVLTALRGPDGTSDYDLKLATTAVVREAVFGAWGAVHHLADVSPDTAVKVAVRLRATPDHFLNHAQDAFRALGLRWEELNKARFPWRPAETAP